MAPLLQVAIYKIASKICKIREQLSSEAFIIFFVGMWGDKEKKKKILQFERTCLKQDVCWNLKKTIGKQTRL